MKESEISYLLSFTHVSIEGSVEMHLFCTSLVLCVLSACHMITSTCDELLTSGDADFCK